MTRTAKGFALVSKMGIEGGRASRTLHWLKLLATVLVAIVAAAVSGDLYAGDMFKGKTLYNTHCAVCHGAGNRPTLPGAPSFTRQENILKPDFTLLAAIRSGKNAMPAYQGMLSDRDIMDIIAYIRTMN